MNLLEYPVGDGIEARYASAGELRRVAAGERDASVQRRLLTVARLREILEAQERAVVEALVGRLDAGGLDDVAIVLEQATQQAVEEELASGSLAP